MSSTPYPPTPIPNALWGETWQFVSLTLGDLRTGLMQRPIPVQHLLPGRSLQDLPLDLLIPGVVIVAGHRSMRLAQWIQRQQPRCLVAMQAELNGLMLQTHTQAQWVLMTFSEVTMVAAGQVFESQKQACQGLHFLLVEPDDSGMTSTGLWLLEHCVS
jgi:hypothetical protein